MLGVAPASALDCSRRAFGGFGGREALGFFFARERPGAATRRFAARRVRLAPAGFHQDLVALAIELRRLQPQRFRLAARFAAATSARATLERVFAIAPACLRWRRPRTAWRAFQRSSIACRPAPGRRRAPPARSATARLDGGGDLRRPGPASTSNNSSHAAGRALMLLPRRTSRPATELGMRACLSSNAMRALAALRSPAPARRRPRLPARRAASRYFRRAAASCAWAAGHAPRQRGSASPRARPLRRRPRRRGGGQFRVRRRGGKGSRGGPAARTAASRNMPSCGGIFARKVSYIAYGATLYALLLAGERPPPATGEETRERSWISATSSS